MEIDIGFNLEKELNNNLEINKNNFLNSNLGNAINNGIDIGLRYLLPDFIEEQIIELKENIMKEGFKEGINKSINSIIEIGKNTLGIFTGNFENLSQVEMVIKKGGILESVSRLLDTIIDKMYEKGKINFNLNKTIKNGKEAILESIENNIKNNMSEQNIINNNLESHINNWKEKYIEKNFSGMEIEYNKIKKESEKLIPIEERIKEIKEIDIIHNFIKNKEDKFNFTENELEIINKLKA